MDYPRMMAEATTTYINQADKFLNVSSACGHQAGIHSALLGIGSALLAQCVLLERIADRLDEGGIGVEVTQA